MAKKINNLHELGTDLLDVYSELRVGSIDNKTASTLAAVAGEVINSLKVQVKYNSLKSNIDKVQLLESNPSNKLIGSKKRLG